MYNLIQFVLRFLISFFLISCSLCTFYFTTHLIMTEARSKRHLLPLVFIDNSNNNINNNNNVNNAKGLYCFLGKSKC